MQQDDVTWSCLKNSFCSFKVMTKTQMMCKNDNNVVGICSKSACPLANSNYATVREHKGVIYLCKKVIERAAFPHKLWEKVRLVSDYEEALKQIDILLPYWNPKQVHRCKQRYTKIFQYLERARKMATKMRSKKLITLPRKMERREKAREKKALAAAKLENNIEMEIMERVKQGVYGERFQFKDKNVFEKALVEREDEEEEEIERPVASSSKVKPIKLSQKYIPDIEDLDGVNAESGDDDDDDFWASEDEQLEMEAELVGSGNTSGSLTRRKAKKRDLLTVEWER